MARTYCPTGEHAWQQEEWHENDAGEYVSERLFCLKCPAWKTLGEPDPVCNVRDGANERPAH